MSIYPADAQPGTAQLILAAVFTVLALSVAWFAGAFRRRSVVGPARLLDDPAESPGRIWGIGLMAFGVWIAVPLFYISIVRTDRIAATTSPTTTSTPTSTSPASSLTTHPAKPTLSPRETILLGVAAQLAGLVVLLIADASAIRGGLSRLGLSFNLLPAGIAKGLIGVMAAVPLTIAASLTVQVFWQYFGFSPPQDHELIRILKQSSAGELRWAVTIGATLIAPVFEETLFRGHLQTALMMNFSLLRPRVPEPRAIASENISAGGQVGVMQSALPLSDESATPVWPRWAAIIVASAAFAMIHEAGWMQPPLFLLAVCLGYVYERTGNLWAPILMHAAFNGLSIAMVAGAS